MSYDPKSLGARCDECPLRGNDFVPTQCNISPLERMGAAVATNSSYLCIVGEAPGEQEESKGIPFVGASGIELDRALRMAGIRRDKTQITNVMLCRPPKNRLKDFLTKIRKEDKKREKKWKLAKKAAEEVGEEPPPRPKSTPTPMECCSARLENEIVGFRNFIALGKVATHALTGMRSSILKIRGGLVELEETDRTPARKVMPTLHPAFCMRQPRWFHVFRNDIYKAGRWFRGEAKWIPPEVTYQPSAATLEKFLSKPGIIYAYDLETDGIEPLTARIRCIGIGTQTEVMMCSVLSKDGYTKLYPREDEKQVIEVLKSFFEDPAKPKLSWNGITYDAPILKQRWGITIQNHIDGILIHKGVESELPHSLAYVVSLNAEAPAWKSDREGNKLSTDAESDQALAEYCAKDVSLTHTVLTPLSTQLALRKQTSVFHDDTKIQHACADMHEIGMYVNQDTRLAKEKALLERRYHLLAEIRERTGYKDFNPGSVYQMRDLLFGDWSLEAPLDDKERLTNSGDPSTADIVLRSLLTDRSTAQDQRDTIKLCRYYRKIQKVLGTYVIKMRTWDEKISSSGLGWDDEDDWVDRETRKRYGLEKKGIVDPKTGRMHPGWSVSVPVTGRLSSYKPMNAMNYPFVLRGIVEAQEGHVLVGADADQLEIRVAAALWGIARYLQAFREGKDPHSMTAYMIFGDAFCTAAGIDPALFDLPGKLVGKAYDERGTFIGKGEAKHLRVLSKGVHFASQYMACTERVHKIIQSTEIEATGKDGKPLNDGTTDLPFALMPLKRVRKMRDNWLGGAPEYSAGWEGEIDTFKHQGYLADAIAGRRRDFLDSARGDDDKVNEIVNFRIQCIRGDQRVLVRLTEKSKSEMLPISSLLGERFLAWTGYQWSWAIAIEKGEAKLYEVRTTGRHCLVCDGTHGFRVFEGEQTYWKNINGFAADPLKVGDEVMLSMASRNTRGTSRLEIRASLPIASIRALEETANVYTLSVEAPEHQYIAEGFVSKNSTAAAWMNKALLQLHEQIPAYKWGPGTGIINQCHDHIVIECPEEKATEVARMLEDAMNGTHPGLPGVTLTASADIGKRWNDV